MNKRIRYFGVCFVIVFCLTMLANGSVCEGNESNPVNTIQSKLCWLSTRYEPDTDNNITVLHTFDFSSNTMDTVEYSLGNGDVYLLVDPDNKNRFILSEENEDVYNLFSINEHQLEYIDSFELPMIDLIQHDAYISGKYIIYMDDNHDAIRFDVEQHEMTIESIWPRLKSKTGNTVNVDEDRNESLLHISIKTNEKTLELLTIGEKEEYYGYNDIFWADDDHCCFVLRRKDNGRKEFLIYSIDQETFVFKKYKDRVFKRQVGDLYPSPDGQYIAYFSQEGFKSSVLSIRIKSLFGNESYLIYEQGENEDFDVHHLLWIS